MAQDGEHSGKDTMEHKQSSLHDGKKRVKNNTLVPKSILIVTLLNGTDLPSMDENGKVIAT